MLTPELTIAFAEHMKKTFGSSYGDKSDSAMMSTVATVLDTFGVQDRERFMRDFATTLYKVIYTPFKIGVAIEAWPLWAQVRVLTHEHQHIVQGEREGWPTFMSYYLTSSSYRAGYEAEAYGCDIELEWWRSGSAFRPHLMATAKAEGLRAYGCDDGDVAQAEAMLGLRADIVMRGVVENRATVEAINWLCEAGITPASIEVP